MKIGDKLLFYKITTKELLLRLDGVILLYFKLSLLNLTEFIVLMTLVCKDIWMRKSEFIVLLMIFNFNKCIFSL